MKKCYQKHIAWFDVFGKNILWGIHFNMKRSAAFIRDRNYRVESCRYRAKQLQCWKLTVMNKKKSQKLNIPLTNPVMFATVGTAMIMAREKESSGTGPISVQSEVAMLTASEPMKVWEHVDAFLVDCWLLLCYRDVATSSAYQYHGAAQEQSRKKLG